MQWLSIIGKAIGLATQVFEKSVNQEKKKYITKLATLKIELEREMQKPMKDQNDGKIEDLLIQIDAITEVAVHEARIIANS